METGPDRAVQIHDDGDCETETETAYGLGVRCCAGIGLCAGTDLPSSFSPHVYPVHPDLPAHTHTHQRIHQELLLIIHHINSLYYL